MERVVKLPLFVACVVIGLICCPTYSVGQAPKDDITERIVSLRLTDESFMRVIGVLAVEQRVPIGLEVGAGPEDEPKLSLEVSNEPLKNVLDLIAQQEPAYRWEVRDGAINFVPKQSRDPLLSQFLSTCIRHFAPKKGINKFGIRDAIADLPEVKSFLDAHRMTVWKLEYPTYRSVYTDDEIDLSVSDTDVRGVLNKVVRDSEHKLWVISRKGEKGEILRMGF